VTVVVLLKKNHGKHGPQEHRSADHAEQSDPCAQLQYAHPAGLHTCGLSHAHYALGLQVCGAGACAGCTEERTHAHYARVLQAHARFTYGAYGCT
jgi:hypothetical protein